MLYAGLLYFLLYRVSIRRGLLWYYILDTV